MATARSAGRPSTRKKNTSAKSLDDKKYLCPYCLQEKKKADFYVCTDSRVLTGITSMCRECVRKIALNWDENRQEFGACTKRSVMEALEYIDRPFLSRVWDASYAEWAKQINSSNKTVMRTTIWDAYIKNISMIQYNGMRWRDGDIFNVYVEDAKQMAALEMGNTDAARTILNGQEINNESEKNRKDVIRLLGYDPFEGEKLEDQPLLYSQLIGYLDLGGDNEDMMRTSSAITIVRGFLQQAKIDDKITKAMANPSVNATEIKTLLDSKQKISSTISQLAEQSCLSLKHSKNASKGENTFTGIVKKLKELNLREAEVNAFDIGTCEGMRQVADISNASIMKQIRLDENDYTEMLAKQREMLVKLQAKSDKNEELSRILLRENLDLKKFIEQNGVDISEYCNSIDSKINLESDTDE